MTIGSNCSVRLETKDFDTDFPHSSSTNFETLRVETTLERFKNPALKDEVTRVGRTPIRKLGYNERFINPIRQASERGLAIDGLIDTVVQILKYNDPADEQAVQLQAMLKEKSVEEVIKEVTQLQEQTIIERIVKAYVD